MRRVNHMRTDMAFDDFGHQAVHRATRGDYQMEYVRAAAFTVDCALQGIDLTTQSSNAVKQAAFFARCMAHFESFPLFYTREGILFALSMIIVKIAGVGCKRRRTASKLRLSKIPLIAGCTAELTLRRLPTS
jgi:hypothetical protein